MTTIAQGITTATSPQPYCRTALDRWRTLAHSRLNAVFETAKEVYFDDLSRIVFFSDCHRGDNSRADLFARNEELFLHALTHYYRQGFMYVEVGDGDELWQNRRFSRVRRAHRRTFDLLHRFERRNRLHLIVGNHDIGTDCHGCVEKDGIVAREGLVLRHARTGQRIFVVHGHQADFVSDQLIPMARFLVRYVRKPLQLLGLANGTVWGDNVQEQPRIEQAVIKWFQAQTRRIEQRIIDWVQTHRQVIVCGHTHRPVCPPPGAPPYFNAGSCMYPGYITGLELQRGEIVLIRWSVRPGRSSCIERELLAPPRRLVG